MSNVIMQSEDAVYGSLAECYITINGRRLNFMSMTDFEGKINVETVTVKILGKVGTGNKAAGLSGTWTATAHYNQSYFREVVLDYQNTGVMPYFEIQVTNEDPSTSIGRQTIIYYGCLCKEFILSKFKAGTELLEEDLSGTFESFDMPEKFDNLDGFITT